MPRSRQTRADRQQHHIRHDSLAPAVDNRLCQRPYTKKAWESSQSLVPHIEAFALPGTVERATQKPTPICHATLPPHHARSGQAQRRGSVMTYPSGIHCCHVLDCPRKLRSSYVSSTKRSKRLIHICPSFPSHSPMTGLLLGE